jgi:hypothetical protein
LTAKMTDRNVFLKFVSGYTDDELLKSVDNQSEFEKDVYNAILTESLQRDLISKVQFDKLFFSGRRSGSGNIKAEEEIQVNREDYWKCPDCGQTVEMNFKVCWNCRQDKPLKIESPSRAKIFRYNTYKKPFNSFKTGFVLIGSGVLILILSYLMTLPDFWGFHYLPLGKFLAGIVFVVLGVLFLLLGLFKQFSGK